MQVFFKAYIKLMSLIPKQILYKLDVYDYYSHKFLKSVSKEVKKGQVILDAGAGACPYKNYFKHAKYESCDYSSVDEAFGALKKNINYSFTCSLEAIPKADNLYDAILCTMTLEHVANPQKAVNECYRILKPGGKLFVTTPFEIGVHGSPYHYFNMTSHGLEYLFKTAGFTVKRIEPMGGIFSCLARRLRTFTTYIYLQYLYEFKAGAYDAEKYTFKPNIPMVMLLTPFFAAYLIFGVFIFPLLFLHLDVLDKKKVYTLGYTSYCVKSKKIR